MCVWTCNVRIIKRSVHQSIGKMSVCVARTLWNKLILLSVWNVGVLSCWLGVSVQSESHPGEKIAILKGAMYNIISRKVYVHVHGVQTRYMKCRGCLPITPC